jgi:hypothetical protein
MPELAAEGLAVTYDPDLGHFIIQGTPFTPAQLRHSAETMRRVWERNSRVAATLWPKALVEAVGDTLEAYPGLSAETRRDLAVQLMLALNPLVKDHSDRIVAEVTAEMLS